MLVLSIALYVTILCLVMGFMYGWVVQSDSQDQAGHLAALVLKHNANTKVKTERINATRKELTKVTREIMVEYYNRGQFENFWRRTLNQQPKALRAKLARYKDLKQQLANDQREIDRYHVLVRGVLHRRERQLPDLVDHLRKMLA